MVIFATATGLRPGEWIALEYRDIDREARFAYVRRAFSYQRNAIDAASAGLESEGRALVILATGLGKTVVAGEVIESQLRGRSSEDVLVVAHVKELVRRGRVAEVVASSGLQFGSNEQAAFQSNEPALPTALFQPLNQPRYRFD
ncbi:MAG: DEAD/DEAH box helicase family protein [Actinobacteria bacterium]|nr:DEAD/DEAH box helicase family protein [Actinomycetota bacterium]